MGSTSTNETILNGINDFLDEKDVLYVVQSYTESSEAQVLEYVIMKASDKMLGYLADYWKLRVDITFKSKIKRLQFFIKSISRSNAGKAEMVKEMKLFEKEAAFYKILKPKLEIPGLPPWSAKLAALFPNDLVFEDLTALDYISRHKMDKFDMLHCQRTLETIARLHAGTIVYEERRKNNGEESYTVLKDYAQYLNRGGYIASSPWFTQCISGGLEALKAFSKYGKNPEHLSCILEKWNNVWLTALDLSDPSDICRNVICHRDLWNNNLLYHYDSSGAPDSCVLVDFQAVRYQPPAGDVMLFLYCSNIELENLDRLLPMLLQHYYSYLSSILEDSGVSIKNVLSMDEFLRTADEQKKWGLVVSACLIPQIWMDEDKVTEIFSDSENFEQILTRDKGQFIKKMMTESEEYKQKVLERFEEIVRRYIILT